MSIDIFLEKQYNEDSYNCAHFVTEVWKELTGEDISSKMDGFLLPPSDRYTRLEKRKAFRRIENPLTPCIVLLQGRKQTPHVGIFFKRRVLHITKRGVQYMPLEIARVGFKSVRFYVC